MVQVYYDWGSFDLKVIVDLSASFDDELHRAKKSL